MKSSYQLGLNVTLKRYEVTVIALAIVDYGHACMVVKDGSVKKTKGSFQTVQGYRIK